LKADVIRRTVLQKMKVAIHRTVLHIAEADRKIQDGPASNEKMAIRRTVLTHPNPRSSFSLALLSCAGHTIVLTDQAHKSILKHAAVRLQTFLY